MAKKKKTKGKKTKGKWIQKARARMKRKGTVGSLRKALGAKKGKPIPYSELLAASKRGGKIGKKANFALNVRKKK